MSVSFKVWLEHRLGQGWLLIDPLCGYTRRNPSTFSKHNYYNMPCCFQAKLRDYNYCAAQLFKLACLSRFSRDKQPWEKTHAHRVGGALQLINHPPMTQKFCFAKFRKCFTQVQCPRTAYLFTHARSKCHIFVFLVYILSSEARQTKKFGDLGKKRIKLEKMRKRTLRKGVAIFRKPQHRTLANFLVLAPGLVIIELGENVFELEKFSQASYD